MLVRAARLEILPKNQHLMVRGITWGLKWAGWGRPAGAQVSISQLGRTRHVTPLDLPTRPKGGPSAVSEMRAFFSGSSYFFLFSYKLEKVKPWRSSEANFHSWKIRRSVFLAHISIVSSVYTWISNCGPDLSTWMSYRYLKLSTSKRMPTILLYSLPINPFFSPVFHGIA